MGLSVCSLLWGATETIWACTVWSEVWRDGVWVCTVCSEVWQKQSGRLQSAPSGDEKGLGKYSLLRGINVGNGLIHHFSCNSRLVVHITVVDLSSIRSLQMPGCIYLALLLTPSKIYCKKAKTKFCDIWTGQYVTFVKAANTGEIYAFGLNNYFQLGTLMAELASIWLLFISHFVHCWVRFDAHFLELVENVFDYLCSFKGFPDMKNKFIPELSKTFAREKNWMAISGGQHHTLALDGKGRYRRRSPVLGYLHVYGELLGQFLACFTTECSLFRYRVLSWPYGVWSSWPR